MTITLHWFLPTAGDSRDIVGSEATSRAATTEYLTQVAGAAENGGFGGVLTPTGTWCEDAWIVSSSLLAATKRLKFIVALRPGLISPTLAGQMAATFQRSSGGRLLLNIVTGGDSSEQQRFGDFLAKDDRYARTGEFIEILKRVWEAEPLDFDGRHYTVRQATTHTPPLSRPPVYFGGASPAAEQVAARHADVYLAWGEPPEMVRERIERVAALAAAEGRRLRFGIRLHVISRERASDAWAETERLLATMDPEVVRNAQRAMQQSESVGQQRMAALHGGSTANLEVSPNLWAGVGLVRGGAGTALVGSHEQVAERIAEYHALGFDEFILSGHPHLEEAYAVSEGVVPLLRRAGLLAAEERPGEPDVAANAYYASPPAAAAASS